MNVYGDDDDDGDDDEIDAGVDDSNDEEEEGIDQNDIDEYMDQYADDNMDRDDHEAWETTDDEESEVGFDDQLLSTELQDLPSVSDDFLAPHARQPIFKSLQQREHTNLSRQSISSLYSRFLPRRGPVLLHMFRHRPYCGQFSRDGSLFYAALQSFQICLYDSLNFKRLAVVNARPGMWTITDCDLSPRNDRLAYSSSWVDKWLF